MAENDKKPDRGPDVPRRAAPQPEPPPRPEPEPEEVPELLGERSDYPMPRGRE
jgi:hypothetical protein